MKNTAANTRPHHCAHELYQLFSSTLPPSLYHFPFTSLVDLIVKGHATAEPAVIKAALSALSRRMEKVLEESLVVHERPRDERQCGRYRVGPSGGLARPYEIFLYSADPVDASCACEDYLRNGLGVCKHILAVIEYVVGGEPYCGPIRQNHLAALDAAPLRGARLRWLPFKPTTARWDWLGGLRLVAPLPSFGGKKSAWTELQKRFAMQADDAGRPLLAKAYGDPSERQQTLHLLQQIAKEAAGLVGGTPQRLLRIDPAIAPMLRAEESHAQAVGRLASVTRTKVYLNALRIRLLPHQKKSIKKFMAGGRLLLADDMGLGKSAQAIACSQILYGSKISRKILVVVPASLKNQWLREWQRFSNLPITMVKGGKERRRKTYEDTTAGVLLTNYEQVIRDLPQILTWAPGFVILDEAQKIKNWDTKTAMAIKAIKAPYRLALTGTPVENNLTELASVMDWVDGMALEPLWRMDSQYYRWDTQGTRRTGVQNLRLLRTQLDHCMLRRVRKNVLKTLPARSDHVVPVLMTKAQSAMHSNLDHKLDIFLRSRRKEREPLSQAEKLILMGLMTQLRLVTNGLALFEFEDIWPDIKDIEAPSSRQIENLHSPKIPALLQLLEDIGVGEGQKVVVFSQWRRMQVLVDWALRRWALEKDQRVLFFSGKESQKKRHQNVIDFHEDPRASILLATDAGGVGINLQGAANICINLDIPWNPAVLEQRIARVHRLGQEHPVSVYDLHTACSIEDRIWARVQNKQALFSGLLDSRKDTVDFAAA